MGSVDYYRFVHQQSQSFVEKGKVGVEEGR